MVRMVRNPPAEEDRSGALQDYLRQHPEERIASVARRFGLSRQRVHQVARRLGLPTRRRAVRPVRLPAAASLPHGNALPPSSPGSDPDEMLSLAAVAAYLQMHPGVVSRWCKAGRLPAVKVGKAYRIRWRDLEAWIEGRRKGV